MVLQLPPDVVDRSTLTSLVTRLEQAAADHAPVIVDVSAITLTNRRFVAAITDSLVALAARTDVRVVCTRLSARRLLHRFGNAALQIFPSVESALAAA